MAIVRPRLIDYYNIPIAQEEVDFAIPFLDILDMDDVPTNSDVVLILS